MKLRVTHASQSKFCLALDSKQRPLRMCGHSAQNLLVLRSPQVSFMFGPYVYTGMNLCRSMHDTWASWLQTMGWRCYLSQKIGPAVGSWSSDSIYDLRTVFQAVVCNMRCFNYIDIVCICISQLNCMLQVTEVVLCLQLSSTMGILKTELAIAHCFWKQVDTTVTLKT